MLSGLEIFNFFVSDHLNCIVFSNNLAAIAAATELCTAFQTKDIT